MILVLVCALAVGALAPAAGASRPPVQDRDWCRQVPPTATWSVKNIEVLCRVDTVRHTWNADGTLATDPTTPSGYRETLTQAIAINFISYGKPERQDVMFIAGRFGLKSFDITNPLQPKLLDWLGDGVDDPFVEEANPGIGSQAPRKGTFDDMWENEDMDVDQHRKLVFLSRDPRAYGGSTGNPASESGIYVIDVKNPEQLTFLSFAKTPTGHTTTCINECKYLWTGGPAANTDQQAMGWAGRPIFVTDVRTPKHPKVNPNPIDLGRNDGTIDYSHDVQVDDMGIAWVSGRGGTRGYWTDGRHFDPILGANRMATPENPVPYAGGGFEETVFPTRTSSRFMHNAWRPLGDDAPDPSYGDLIYATEEEFAGGAFPNGCANDGPLFISRLEGSYNGEGWRSTPSSKFRLKTVATWHPVRQGGLVHLDGLLGPLLPDQGPHPVDVVLQPGLAVPRHLRPDCSDGDRLLPARHGLLGDVPAPGPVLLGRPQRRLHPAPDGRSRPAQQGRRCAAPLGSCDARAGRGRRRS